MISHIMTVGIYVRDQDAARDFYVNKLGFEVRDDREGGGLRWLEVAPPGAQTTVVLATKDYPAGSEEKVGIYTDIAFQTEDIQATYETYTQRGVKFTAEPELMPYGKWFAAFVDPDGNEFFLYQPA
jgi:lactoylglutathione lyase